MFFYLSKLRLFSDFLQFNGNFVRGMAKITQNIMTKPFESVLIFYFIFLQKFMDTEAGPSLMDDKDIDTLKKYDMAIDKALRELEVEAPKV